MTASRKKWVAIGTILISIGVVVYGEVFYNKTWISTCPRFDPIYWEGIQSFLGVRTETDGSLLLASFGEEQFHEKESATPTRTIFHWSPGSDQLTVASKEDWTHGIQPAIPPKTSFSISNRSLVRHGEIVRTEGRTVDAFGLSPDGKLLAVASTDARWTGGMWFGLGGGLQSTLWFHQAFDEQTGKQVGKTLALRSDEKMWRPEIGWSRDSKYVVYLGQDSRWVWIAPVKSR